MTEEKHYWNFRLRLFLAEIRLDCEKSLFFFRFSERNARAAGKPRDARNEGGTRVVICVSRVLLDGLQKKERLLVV